MRIDAPFAISVIIGGLIGAAGLVVALTWPWSGLPGITSGAPQGVESPAGSRASPDAPGVAGQPAPAASGTVVPSAPMVTAPPAAGRTVAPTPALPSLPPAPPAAVPGADPTEQHAVAARLLAQGRLQEAQDVYLDLLLSDPADARAIEGLVAVRRRMARDDPALLRRQAAAYQRAAAAGVETDEHYTPRAMRELARACVLAAEEVDAEQRTGRPTPAPLPAPSATRRGQAPPRVVILPATPQEVVASTPEARPASPRVVRTPTPRPRPSPSPSLRARRRTPTPRPAARVSPSPRSRRPRPTPVPSQAQVRPAPPRAQQVTPTPAATPTTRPTPQPPAASPPEPDTREPYYVVHVGPFNDRDRASEMAAQLSLAGLSPRISAVQEAQRFEVVSEVLPITVAERRIEALASLGIRARVRQIGGGLALLEFGVFVSEQNAEALARRIRSRGYFATVVREGGDLYLIALGPYRVSTIEAVIRTIRSRLGTVTVTTVPANPP